MKVDAWAFPFLDTDAILAAIDCHRLGIDVYAVPNPCDPIGRPHVYPPLWLHLDHLSVGRGDLNVIGLTLDLLFFVALAVLPPVCNRTGAALFLCAIVSPSVALALERANNDVLMFVLGTMAGRLVLRRSSLRLAAYAITIESYQ